MGAQGDVLTLAFRLSGASVLVRFVQRPPEATRGAFQVAHLEHAKHSGHDMTRDDVFCGVDKWYDNHFGWDQHDIQIDTFKNNSDSRGRAYHVFGDCKPATMGPGTNIYVVDPTGDAVQIDAPWKACPSGGSGDALQNACSQGNCSKFKASASCASKLASTCALVRLQNSTCTDCVYLQWGSLAAAGCRNADLVNYCVGVSSSRLQLLV